MNTRSRLLRLGVIAFFLAPFVLPLVIPWSRINCHVQEIDVDSGLRRDTHYIYWIPILRSIRNTPLSDALGNPLSSDDDRPWKRVNTFGPYKRHSPHHIYHSAFSQIRELQMIWKELDYDARQRKESAEKLLREWRTSGSDASVHAYLREL